MDIIKKELLISLAVFCTLFSVHTYYYDLWLNAHTWYFGFAIGFLIAWPVIVMRIKSITFRDVSFKFLGANIFGYAAYISGGLFSPVMAFLFFLSLNVMPHTAIVKTRISLIAGPVCAISTLFIVALLEYYNLTPAKPYLALNETIGGVVTVLLGGIIKTVLVDQLTFVPVTQVMQQMKFNDERNKELEKARDAAIELSQTKSVFLTQMSHELRTPLNAIIGFSEIMKMEMLGEMRPEYKQYAEDIYESGQNLATVVNKVLDMANLENGHYELNIKDFNPLDAVLTVKNAYNELLEKKQMTLIIDCYIGDISFHSDEDAITQILMHIIGNAVHHCPDGVTIHVGIFHDDHDIIRYVISDNGSGFSQKILDNFGKPFNIDVNPMQDNSAISGLGLSITKKTRYNVAGRNSSRK